MITKERRFLLKKKLESVEERYPQLLFSKAKDYSGISWLIVSNILYIGVFSCYPDGSCNTDRMLDMTVMTKIYDEDIKAFRNVDMPSRYSRTARTLEELYSTIDVMSVLQIAGVKKNTRRGDFMGRLITDYSLLIKTPINSEDELVLKV